MVTRSWNSLCLVCVFLFAMTGPAAAQTVPTLSISDVSEDEGDRGTNNARFVVTLSAAATQPVSVQYSTANDSATSGQDYTAQTSKTLTFEPGDTTESFGIELLGDTTDEPNEKFFVNLNNPTNATISDGQAVGTIVDDDGATTGPTTPTTRPTPTPTPTPSPSASPSPTPSLAPAAPVTPAPSPSPSPSPPPGIATTGSSEQAALIALATLTVVLGFMLRRSVGDETL